MKKEVEVNVQKRVNWCKWDELWDEYVKQEKFLEKILKFNEVKLNEKFESTRREKKDKKFFWVQVSLH